MAKSTARRRRAETPRVTPPIAVVPGPVAVAVAEVAPAFWTRRRAAIAATLLLVIHLTAAVRSLLAENPTIDEVVHLPAGISYIQQGTFRLYHHNPPLVKMIAAWPVVRSGVVTDPLYQGRAWLDDNKFAFAHEFMKLNAARYFEKFDLARLAVVGFSVLGGLAVFAWSARLFGRAGGLLSLCLWCLCPNILAHARLVTSDVAATSMMVAASYLFWRYLKRPGWLPAVGVGIVLGLAELTKFSAVVLYGLWPVIAAADILATSDRGTLAGRAGKALLHGLAMVAISVLVIDLGYGFEGVGTPIGSHRFVSRMLTRDASPTRGELAGAKDWHDRAKLYRINRFSGTFIGSLPGPLPTHYLLGFDDQKLEADGIPRKMLTADFNAANAEELAGYPVFLDGVLSNRGWKTYYLRALAYKTPEGTLALVWASLLVLLLSRRCRRGVDEVPLVVLPLATLGAVTFGTDINIGLRYILPIFPYAFITAGRLAPWASGLAGATARRVAIGGIFIALAATATATATIYPSFLAYFNWASGGPDRGSEHLVDSNLDWGQDLVNLRRWVDQNARGQAVGLAYFGQINPSIFDDRDNEPFPWFLPPPRPGTMPVLPPDVEAGTPPKPGLYAVSATLLRGIQWRVYDPTRWAPWEAKAEAFGYFRELKPIANVGHSILIYRIDEADARRLAEDWAR